MAKKIAVISGGTSGIGKRLVTMFVKSGCKVVTFSRKKSNINRASLKWEHKLNNQGDK